MAAKLAGEIEQVNAHDRQAIDLQVERMLKHPLFHQSKRLPAFLRYIVETSLSHGGRGSTKERTVGVEVFGRKPDYDNNSDPIVRVTATELRKKLAQYYYEDGHGDEIRIELPPGSYLPRFRRSVEADNAADEQLEAASTEMSTAITVVPEQNPPLALGDLPSPVAAGRRISPWPVLTAVLCLLLTVVTGLLLRNTLSTSRSSLDRFWSQLAGHANRVFIVMPVIGSDNVKNLDTTVRGTSVSPNLSLEDTDIAARIASQLEKHGNQFRLVSSSEVELDQLQTEPAVLIGALDNIWTIRLMQNLPFVFEEAPDHRTGRILDTTASGGAKNWSVDIDMPHRRISRDYGIVARYTNRLTGQPVVVVAGISSQGTQAAGKLLTSPEFDSIRTIAEKASNFEVVIQTEAIDGHAAPPQIVATRVW